MSKPVANPTRLSCLPATEDTLDVGRLFRNARELPNEELPTLRWRLRTSLRLRAMRPRLVLRVAVVIAVVFCLGGVVGAVVSPFWPRQQPADGTDKGAVPAPRPRKARPAPTTPARSLAEPVPLAAEPGPTLDDAVPAAPAAAPIPDVAVAQAHPSVDQPPTTPTVATHRAAARVAMASPGRPSATPASLPPGEAPSPIAAEQTLVGQAMRALRDGHDARAALSLLGQHAERFPAGMLTAEATALRVEALLALGRQDDALALLDRMPLASLPNRDEQLVVRGELRAASGRWREAKQDFDEALRQHGLPASAAKVRQLQQRALWGRAAAHSRLGAEAAARADLELYLRHFPSGQFAGAAASLLKPVP